MGQDMRGFVEWEERTALRARVAELEAALRHTVRIANGEPRGMADRLEAFVERALAGDAAPKARPQDPCPVCGGAAETRREGATTYRVCDRCCVRWGTRFHDEQGTGDSG